MDDFFRELSPNPICLFCVFVVPNCLQEDCYLSLFLQKLRPFHLQFPMSKVLQNDKLWQEVCPLMVWLKSKQVEALLYLISNSHSHFYLLYFLQKLSNKVWSMIMYDHIFYLVFCLLLWWHSKFRLLLLCPSEISHQKRVLLSQLLLRK